MNRHTSVTIAEFEEELWHALRHHLLACHDPQEDLQIDVPEHKEYERRYYVARDRVLAQLERSRAEAQERAES